MPEVAAKGGRMVRAIAGYGIVAFALLQIIEPIMHGLHLPDATLTFFLIGLALVFPLVIAVSWSLDRLQLPGGPAPERGAAWSTRRVAGSPASFASLLLPVAVASWAPTLFASRPPGTSPRTPPTPTTLTCTPGSPTWS